MSVSVRGISSGIDINGIIEELMQLERQPIRRKEAMIERTEQIAELWREVNTRLDTLNRTLPPLLQELTFTAPMPKSSDENVLTAKISGMPVEGSYRFNVTQMATYHSVASDPPTVGQRINNPNSALDLFGTFRLGTGRSPESLNELTFNPATTGDWLRGNFGTGFQAVVSGSDSDVYALEPTALTFAGDYPTAEKIDVYFDSFTDAGGEDISADLEAYFTSKGWAVDLEQPLFVLEEDGGGWIARAQHGGVFGFLGDHPLGTFGLRAETIDNTGATVAINNFDFAINDSVDETGLITIEADDSLLEIANKINALAYETGVIASVVQANAGDFRLVLESTVEGGDGFIQAFDYNPLSGGAAKYGNDAILATLNILSNSTNTAVPAFELEAEEALDAQFTLNGLSMTRSSNTFTDVISGLEITLTGLGPSTLTVTPDIDSAVEEINLFVEAVNEVNSYLRVLQKDKEGPLQGSSDLMRIERQLRTLMHGLVSNIPGSTHLAAPLAYSGTAGSSGSATASGQYTGTASSIVLNYYSSTGTWRYNGETFNSGDTIDGVTINLGLGTPSNQASLTLNVTPPSTPLTYNSLSAIGIMAADEVGMLVIDDTKLREALTADPYGIFTMFARDTGVGSQNGLGVQMKSLVNQMIGTNGLVQSRQTQLQSQITQYQDRIEMLERRMEVREQRLVRQFTFMEQYIARIQEQTGLMSSFELMMNQQRE